MNRPDGIPRFLWTESFRRKCRYTRQPRETLHEPLQRHDDIAHLSLRLHDHKNIPPDASSRWPFTQRPAAEQRNATTPAMSSGTPTRPRATFDSRKLFAPGCDSASRLKSVAMTPRATTLTPIRRGPSSFPPRSQFLGQVTGKHLDRAFHRPIRGESGNGEPGQAAGRVDDPAAVADQREQPLREKKDALEVHIHQAVERLFRLLREGSHFVVPRLVHPSVEIPSLPLGLH